MKTHELKTWHEPFCAIINGTKLYEVRKDDRGFMPGDILVLKEFDPIGETYSGREIRCEVGHMSSGGHWGLPKGLCVMSLVKVSPVEWLMPKKPSGVLGELIGVGCEEL